MSSTRSPWVEGRIPAVIHPRARGKPDLADDLHPKVQCREGVSPRLEWQDRPLLTPPISNGHQSSMICGVDVTAPCRRRPHLAARRLPDGARKQSMLRPATMATPAPNFPRQGCSASAAGRHERSWWRRLDTSICGANLRLGYALVSGSSRLSNRILWLSWKRSRVEFRRRLNDASNGDGRHVRVILPVCTVLAIAPAGIELVATGYVAGNLSISRG